MDHTIEFKIYVKIIQSNKVFVFKLSSFYSGQCGTFQFYKKFSSKKFYFYQLQEVQGTQTQKSIKFQLLLRIDTQIYSAVGCTNLIDHCCFIGKLKVCCGDQQEVDINIVFPPLCSLIKK